ncbi:MAG: hypothetical protein RLZZ70_154 [Candidatus Parcubacteria bacterium]|jgi:hypothetical protein
MVSDSLFEGKIVILSFTECNQYQEDTACLVYRVVNGCLMPLLGVLNLPEGLSWHRTDYDQYQVALDVIRKTGCTEVFSPYYTTHRKPFFGENLGCIALGEELNDRGEIEEWCELGAFTYDFAMIRLLEECQIKVSYIDLETMQVVVEKN